MNKKTAVTKKILYTIGFPDCYDFKQSIISAKLLKLETKHIKLNENKLCKNLEEYNILTNDTDKVSISFTLPFFILLKKIPEKNIISGHGADTLFGGFYKYLKIENLKYEIQDNYDKFLYNLANREYRIAKYFNKKLILPFADKKIGNYILSLPEELFIKDNIRKYLLRKVAKEFGLPSDIIKLPKKAFQYSSGIMNKLRKIW